MISKEMLPKVGLVASKVLQASAATLKAFKLPGLATGFHGTVGIRIIAQLWEAAQLEAVTTYLGI